MSNATQTPAATTSTSRPDPNFGIAIKITDRNAERTLAIAQKLGMVTMRRNKATDAGVEAAFTAAMHSQGLSEARPGRGDSGTQVVNNEQGVGLAQLLEDMATNGFRLIEAIRWQIPNRDTRTGSQVHHEKGKRPVDERTLEEIGEWKYTLEFLFVHITSNLEENLAEKEREDPEVAEEMKKRRVDPAKVAGILKWLAAGSFQFTHVWSNSTWKDTVNLVGRNEQARPRQLLGIEPTQPYGWNLETA